MGNPYYRIFFLITLLLSSYSSLSQSGVESTTYLWADQIVGLENSGLIKGTEYLEQNISINDNNKYFLSPHLYISGSITVEGEPFYGLHLKYNIFDDLLLLRVEISGGIRIFQPQRNKIDAFSIADHRFINIKDEKENQTGLNGFHEVLLEKENLVLYKKHLLKRKKLLKKKFIYFEFEKNDPDYVIKYKGVYSPATKRRQILQEFPNQRKPIRKFYKEHKKERKENPDHFMVLFTKELSRILKQDKT